MRFRDAGWLGATDQAPHFIRELEVSYHGLRGRLTTDRHAPMSPPGPPAARVISRVVLAGNAVSKVRTKRDVAVKPRDIARASAGIASMAG